MHNRPIKAQLTDLRVEPLRPDERDAVWQAVVAAKPMVSSAVTTPNNPTLLFITVRPMYTAIAAALIILVSSGATVAAADSARPGDLLFGVDTTVERVRVALADEDKKTELRARFAEERAIEAESLIVEAENRNRTAATTVTSSTVSTTEHTDDDSTTRKRAAEAAEQAIAALRAVESELAEKGNEIALQAIRDARLRLEARTVRIESDSDDRTDDSRNDDDTVSRTTTNTTTDGSATRIEEIEVDVIDGTAYIKIEANDQKRISEVALTDRAAIISHIAQILGVSEDTVSDRIDIEYSSGSMRSDNARSSDDTDEDRSEQRDYSDSDDTDEDRSERKDDSDSDDADEDRSDRSSDDVSRIEDTSTLTRVKIEIEDNQAKVEVRFASGGEDEYRLNTTNVTEVRADIERRYGVTGAVLDSMLRIEMD